MSRIEGKMRRAAKVDGNHAEIVKALRAVKATVQDLSMVGGGCPDLLVGYRKVNYLIEVKDPSQPPSKRELRESQVKWHGDWKGQVAVCETVDAALFVIGAKNLPFRGPII